MIHLHYHFRKRPAMKPEIAILPVFILCVLIFGFAKPADAVKYLWQIALE